MVHSLLFLQRLDVLLQCSNGVLQCHHICDNHTVGVLVLVYQVVVGCCSGDGDPSQKANKDTSKGTHFLGAAADGCGICSDTGVCSENLFGYGDHWKRFFRCQWGSLWLVFKRTLTNFSSTPIRWEEPGKIPEKQLRKQTRVPWRYHPTTPYWVLSKPP